MPTELSLVSLTEIQKLAQQQPQLGTGTWQWTGQRPADDDDSWETRAFAQDTSSALGTTWPPRSYTCAFCRREFRSAQALGGHMNVHRRDRARLRQDSSPSPSSTPASSPPAVFPSPEFVANGGLCLFYPIPPHGAVYAPAVNSSSTLLPLSPYPVNGLAVNLHSPPTVHGHASRCHVDIVDLTRRVEEIKESKDGAMVVEELDLELRLGW